MTTLHNFCTFWAQKMDHIDGKVGYIMDHIMDHIDGKVGHRYTTIMCIVNFWT